MDGVATKSLPVCVSGSQSAGGNHWRRQRGSGGPQEMNKGADSETHPCVACVEEEVVGWRLYVKGAPSRLLSNWPQFFFFSERGKDISLIYGISASFFHSNLQYPDCTGSTITDDLN